jgi:hypothetical protein
MDDMIQPKRSLKDVLPKQQQAGYKSAPVLAEQTPPRANPKEFNRRTRRTGGMKLVIFIILIFLLVAGGLVASTVMARANLEVTPRQVQLALDNTYESSLATGAELVYKVMSMSDEESRTITASGSEQLEQKATGQIIVYNAFGPEPQQLVASTRFETKDGKIFRISQGVTVPGGKNVGGTFTPGSLEVTVTADEPGEEYNLANADFTIPGFKGTARYDKFYARTKTATAGGFKGSVPKVADEDKIEATTELKAILRERLTTEARAQIPAEFVLYDDAVVVSYQESYSAAGNNAAELKIKATLQGIILNREELSGHLAKRHVPGYMDESVLVTNLEDLSFELEPGATIIPGETETISFNLKGTAKLVWQFDQTVLKSELTSAKSSNYQQILANYPAIETAEISFMPPWIRGFPSNVDKIKIQIIAE